MNKVKKIICNSIGKLCKAMSVYSVNSCCVIYFSQDKEPYSLKKYKTH